MSGKRTKVSKRVFNRQANKCYTKGTNDILDSQYGCNLWGRIKIAVSIIFKIK